MPDAKGSEPFYLLGYGAVKRRISCVEPLLPTCRTPQRLHYPDDLIERH